MSDNAAIRRTIARVPGSLVEDGLRSVGVLGRGEKL